MFDDFFKTMFDKSGRPMKINNESLVVIDEKNWIGNNGVTVTAILAVSGKDADSFQFDSWVEMPLRCFVFVKGEK